MAMESDDRVKHVSKAPELAMLTADVASTSGQGGRALQSSSVELPRESISLHLQGAEERSLPSFVKCTWIGRCTGMALRRRAPTAAAQAAAAAAAAAATAATAAAAAAAAAAVEDGHGKDIQ